MKILKTHASKNNPRARNIRFHKGICLFLVSSQSDAANTNGIVIAIIIEANLKRYIFNSQNHLSFIGSPELRKSQTPITKIHWKRNLSSIKVIYLHIDTFPYSWRGFREPGLALSSIILTPQPYPGWKWLSSKLALSPQAQQNWYRQKAHVMWLQPLFFSIRVRHIGHMETLSLFFWAQPCSLLSIIYSHEVSLPCHSSLQWKQTQV